MDPRYKRLRASVSARGGPVDGRIASMFDVFGGYRAGPRHTRQNNRGCMLGSRKEGLWPACLCAQGFSCRTRLTARSVVIKDCAVQVDLRAQWGRFRSRSLDQRALRRRMSVVAPAGAREGAWRLERRARLGSTSHCFHVWCRLVACSPNFVPVKFGLAFDQFDIF